MPPNQTVPPPSDGNDPYAFIMQEPPKQRRSIVPGAGAPRKQRLMFGLGLLGILALFGIVLAVIFSGGGGNMQPMIEIAQSQNEIIRVASAGGNDIKGASTLAFSQNTFLTMTTDQQDTLAFISKSQKAPNAKVLSQTKSSSTDAKLETASQASRYDEVFTQVLVQELTDYKNQVNEAYKATNSVSQKGLLKLLYEHATVLLESQSAAN